MKKSVFLLITVLSILFVSCGTENIEFKNNATVPYLVSETVNTTISELPDSVKLPSELYTVDVSGGHVYVFKIINNKAIPAYNIDIEEEVGGFFTLGLIIGVLGTLLILGLCGAFE